MVETSLRMQPIYSGRVIKLEVHDVQLGNGKTSMRELVRHPGAVAVVPLDENGHVLMVRQFRFAAGQEMLEIPAGTLEVGEDPDVCAVRELREETGYAPGDIRRIGGIFVAPGYTTEFIHLYVARDLKHDPLAMDDDEQIAVERIPLPEVLGMIESGRITDGKTVVGILRVAHAYAG